MSPAARPGRSRLWEEFQELRKSDALAATYEGTKDLSSAFQASPGIGTPAEFRKHVHSYEDAGVDQIILLQQAGRNAHADICASLELFARYVMPHFRGHTLGYRDEWQRLQQAATDGGVKLDREGQPSNLVRLEDLSQSPGKSTS